MALRMGGERRSGPGSTSRRIPWNLWGSARGLCERVCLVQKSREGGVREGGVAQICRKLRKGCTKSSQICRKFENQFRTILCKYPFSKAPFSKLLNSRKPAEEPSHGTPIWQRFCRTLGAKPSFSDLANSSPKVAKL